MKRCDNIINNPTYREYLRKNAEREKERRFCRHDMTHFFDTARIGYMLILENELDIPKYMIYAAALVHDIARCDENELLRHDEASARFAEKLLPQCGFTADETERIASAVRMHRQPDSEKGEFTLGKVLYLADKLSRRCFECSAYSECNWAEDKKNNNISY